MANDLASGAILKVNASYFQIVFMANLHIYQSLGYSFYFFAKCYIRKYNTTFL